MGRSPAFGRKVYSTYQNMRIDCYELAKILKENGCLKAFITDLLRKHFGLDRTTADYVCQIPDKDWKIITRRNYKYARMKTRTLLWQGMNEWEIVDLVSGTFRISSHDVHTMLKEITLYERENESVETIEARISCFVNLLNEQPHDRETIKNAKLLFGITDEEYECFKQKKIKGYE